MKHMKQKHRSRPPDLLAGIFSLCMKERDQRKRRSLTLGCICCTHNEGLSRSRARSLACDTFAGRLIHCSCIVRYICHTLCVRYAAIVGQAWLSCIRWPPRIRWDVAQSRDRNPVRNCAAYSNHHCRIQKAARPDLRDRCFIGMIQNKHKRWRLNVWAVRTSSLGMAAVAFEHFPALHI